MQTLSLVMKYKSISALAAAFALIMMSLSASASAPGATSYTFAQCEGSLTPYPGDILPAPYPDSLQAVFVNYVGRHGARYPSSASNCLALRAALGRADSAGTITPLGRQLSRLNEKVMALSTDRWGALDSLGMAEQGAIATRLFLNFADIFAEGRTVEARSSYSPRSMMSMFSFLHQLDRMDNRINYVTTTGRVNSAALRPFDIDQDYLQFRKDAVWRPAYEEYMEAACPVTGIRKVLGERFPFKSDEEARSLALVEYHVLAGLRAMGLPPEMSTFLSKDEANALWSCFNLRQYLQRTATTLSPVPADIAAQLVLDLVETTDTYIASPDSAPVGVFRFGHAETLMPLLSLLRLPGCYYMTNYFDTVALHWRDFDVVPMAANVQFILFRAKESGKYYVRVDLNERPVALRKGDPSVYYPWGELRRYLMDCVPLYMQ